ncbi:MAG: SPOR domain-containing protein [Chlorobi bacterium]|nr:SPOR domain-containing protein [Chlorobiota bacterium]
MKFALKTGMMRNFGVLLGFLFLWLGVMAQDDTTSGQLKSDTTYYIQLLAFSHESLAKEALTTAEKRLNMPVIKVKENNLIKLRVGPFSTKDSATNTLIKIKKHYPDAFVVKVVNNDRKLLFPFKKDNKAEAEPVAMETKCYVQVGSFMSRANAITESWKYDKYPQKIVSKEGLWRIWLGPYSCEEAYQVAEEVKVINPGAFVVKDTVVIKEKVISQKPLALPQPQHINISPDIDSLNSSLIKKNSERKTIQGYRVQLAMSPKRQEIFELKAKFLKEYNDIPAYVVYDPPLFKLQVGNYLRLMDARRARIELSKKYPNAIVVWQEIPIDEIKRTHFSDSE